MAETPADFYDSLAARYHLLFDDWWAAARWHGDVVARLLGSRGVPTGRLLDCTCGVGTQALPLATAGYRVTGTDVSRAAVERAGAEAADRGIELDLAVADVRRVDEAVEGPFDAVISCDNALPHLLTDEDLGQALHSIRRCLRPSGVLLVSIRDYDALRSSRPPGVPVTVHGEPGSRHASGQSWAWSADGELVDIELFTLVEGSPEVWEGHSDVTRYRALLRDRLESLTVAAGFVAVRWLMPEESGYYQPVMTATATADPPGPAGGDR
jgi:glycine/sarcosine N-methyltransferase